MQTEVLIARLHESELLAKQSATLDRMSGGAARDLGGAGPGPWPSAPAFSAPRSACRYHRFGGWGPARPALLRPDP
ncbi:hypothetical protein [Streptosporangium subroseum]|uniref:hypothetical protein n=1 Tax=Streptosporangium subroseum TaxID=106412 RepID=UPI001FE667EA|nr:hypothetical protein [Streptosporangium subroseum]